MTITRFAPSPTGHLHLGHAASALFAHEQAKAAGGTFLLRIEDIDPVRCKAEFTEAIFEDLAWLGLNWPEPVRRQSQHMADYAAALDKLREDGLVYPCFCTRKEVAAEAAAAGHAPHLPPDGGEGPVYAGTCRLLSENQRQELAAQRDCVWRLDMQEALRRTVALKWFDQNAGEVIARPQDFGDVVLARKDVATSYHLSVVVDDALQGVTLVTRGTDLFRVTDIHRVLQALLGLPTPAYHHHPLVRDAGGKRLAKRDKAVTIRALREAGYSRQEVASMAVF